MASKKITDKIIRESAEGKNSKNAIILIQKTIKELESLENSLTEEEAYIVEEYLQKLQDFSAYTLKKKTARDLDPNAKWYRSA